MMYRIHIYRLLNEYSVLVPSSLVGSNSLVPKHCTSSITELLYISIQLSISLNNIRSMLVFIPKHRIDRHRHSVHLHARVVILKTQAGYMRGVTNQCMTSAIVQ